MAPAACGWRGLRGGAPCHASTTSCTPALLPHSQAARQPAPLPAHACTVSVDAHCSSCSALVNLPLACPSPGCPHLPFTCLSPVSWFPLSNSSRSAGNAPGSPHTVGRVPALAHCGSVAVSGGHVQQACVIREQKADGKPADQQAWSHHWPTAVDGCSHCVPTCSLASHQLLRAWVNGQHSPLQLIGWHAPLCLAGRRPSTHPPAPAPAHLSCWHSRFGTAPAAGRWPEMRRECLLPGASRSPGCPRRSSGRCGVRGVG